MTPRELLGVVMMAMVTLLQWATGASDANVQGSSMLNGILTTSRGLPTAGQFGAGAQAGSISQAPLTADLSPLSAGNTSLSGLSLRYLIGADSAQGASGSITVVPYHQDELVQAGESAGYCNLFDESGSEDYGPYLAADDVAAQYGEGRIDPNGPGWERNLRQQFERRRNARFRFIELDNSHAYPYADVIRAIDLAATYGLAVIAKNPIADKADVGRYLGHPGVVGIIVEHDGGDPAGVDQLRRAAGKPNLPVWFVCFGNERGWGEEVARTAQGYACMGVTHSEVGEYRSVSDLLRPVPAR